MKEKDIPRAILVRKTTAMDYTPIYYFRATKNIKSGTILRWDSAETEVMLDTLEYESRDDVED